MENLTHQPQSVSHQGKEQPPGRGASNSLVSPTDKEIAFNMPFTVSLGSEKTFSLFHEAKLKSGQKSDEEFVRQMLAEHGLLSRSAEEVTCRTRGTQVDALDLVENDDSLTCPAKDYLVTVTNTEKLNLEEVFGTEESSINNVICTEDNNTTKSRSFPVKMSKHSDNSKSIAIGICNKRTEVHLTQTLSDKFTDDPIEDNAEKSSSESPDDPEKPDVCVTMFGCKECLMYFSKHDNVLSHIKNVHSGLLNDSSTCKDFVTQESTLSGVKKTFQTVCPKVEFGVISEKEVTEAVQNQQEEIKERKRKLAEKKTTKSTKVKEVFKCTECSGVFRRERSLRDHMKLRHSTEHSNLPKCEVCNKTFLYESILKRHMSLSHSQDPGSKLSKNPKGFLCETCGSTFTQKHTLKLHMNKHLNIKPYMCNHCGKKFTWLNALEYHERTHTGERPYSCHLCTQRFKTPSDLKRHQVVHTKEKPFACTFCPKKFSQGTTLRKHVVKIHGTPDSVQTVEQTTFDEIISLIPILQQQAQVTIIDDDTIELHAADVSCIATL